MPKSGRPGYTDTANALLVPLPADLVGPGGEADDVLHRAAGLLSSVQRLTHVGLWRRPLLRLDTVAGQSLVASRGFLQIYGLPLDTPVLSAEVLLSSIDPEDAERVARTAVEGIKAGRFGMDFRLVRPGGEVRFVHAEAETWRHPVTGEALEMVGALQDLTDQVTTTEDLRQSAERLRLALLAGRLTSFELDYRTNIGRFSANSDQFFGMPAGTAMPMEDFARVIHPDDQQRVLEVVARARAEDTGYEVPFRIVRPDTGAVVHVELRADKLRLPTGESIGSHGVLMDVTAQHELEEARRKSERYRIEFETAPEALLILQLGTYRFKDANRAAERLFGYSQQELLALPTSALRPDRQPDGGRPIASSARSWPTCRTSCAHR